MRRLQWKNFLDRHSQSPKGKEFQILERSQEIRNIPRGSILEPIPLSGNKAYFKVVVSHPDFVGDRSIRSQLICYEAELIDMGSDDFVALYWRENKKDDPLHYECAASLAWDDILSIEYRAVV